MSRDHQQGPPPLGADPGTIQEPQGPSTSTVQVRAGTTPRNTRDHAEQGPQPSPLEGDVGTSGVWRAALDSLHKSRHASDRVERLRRVEGGAVRDQAVTTGPGGVAPQQDAGRHVTASYVRGTCPYQGTTTMTRHHGRVVAFNLGGSLGARWVARCDGCAWMATAGRWSEAIGALLCHQAEAPA